MKRILIALAMVAVFIGYSVALGIGSAMALADITTRPIVALTRDGGQTRIAVQAAGQPLAEGEAALGGGQGVRFGYDFDFRLPTNDTVTCTIRFRALTCSDGWTPER